MKRIFISSLLLLAIILALGCVQDNQRQNQRPGNRPWQDFNGPRQFDTNKPMPFDANFGFAKQLLGLPETSGINEIKQALGLPDNATSQEIFNAIREKFPDSFPNPRRNFNENNQ